jgi:hypothetical protein
MPSRLASGRCPLDEQAASAAAAPQNANTQAKFRIRMAVA